MAGVKTFTNNTPATVSVILTVRSGDNPANYADTTTVTLAPNESRNVEYGNNSNVYLNGYTLNAAVNGEFYSKNEYVTVRGSRLDNVLNTNSKYEVQFDGNNFVFNAHN